MIRSFLACNCFAVLACVQGQSISPSVIGDGGASTVLPGGQVVSWTVSETVTEATYVNGGWVTPGFHQSQPQTVAIFPKVFLEGRS